MCGSLYKVSASLNYNGEEIKELQKYINLVNLLPDSKVETDYQRHQIKLVIYKNDTYQVFVDNISNDN